jgi:hypothetical protein
MFWHIAISDQYIFHLRQGHEGSIQEPGSKTFWQNNPRQKFRNRIRTKLTDPNPGGLKSDGSSGSGQLPETKYLSPFKIHGVAAFWYRFKQCSGSGSGSESFWALRIRIRGTGDPDPDSPIIKQK